MNEAAAREVTLLQAFETAQPPSPSWVADDRVWADRVALEAAGTSVEPDAFLAERAHHAMQRLGSRESAAARWLAQPLWRGRWIAATALIAFAIGLLADSIGASQRINLLAPPLWGVLLWNVVVYLVLIVAPLVRLIRRDVSAEGGPLVRGMQALLRQGRRLPKAGGSAAALGAFSRLWTTRNAALSVLRAETVLHAAAAALGLGLIAGLYARGLALDYRAAWESTFLSPGVAHALVGWVLAPASWLSGIALPEVAGFAAMQATPADATAGAPAAPWIHLFALTLLLLVVLPRLLLALVCALRSRRFAARFPMPLDDPYFQRLLRLQRGAAAQLQIWPYAITPSAQAALGLRTVLAEAFGARVAVQIAPTVAFGAEDGEPLAPSARTSHAIAWFDLSATPEIENHGRFVRQLAGAAPPGASVIVLVDETSFKHRFGATPDRIAQRRDAWRRLCEKLATLPVFVDLEAPDAAAAGDALQTALARPVRAATAGDEPQEVSQP